MARVSKIFAFGIIVIVALSTMSMAESAYAQTGVTQPVIPRFDVSLSGFTDYVPPTYGVDPATGKAVIVKEGYEELYKWVSVRTWGQPFWEYNNSEGYRVLLYYNVRWQSNLDNSWQSFPSEEKYFHDSMDPWDTYGEGYVISIGFKEIKGGSMQLLDPNAVEIGFQVEALIGYYDSNNIFVGQSSGWSETQTLTLSNPSTSATPIPSPTVPEFPFLLVIPLLLSVLAVALMVRKKQVSNRISNMR